jgi:hypothetical protein
MATKNNSEMFFDTYRKWLQEQSVHTQLVVTKVFDKNDSLYISNSRKRVAVLCGAVKR